MGIQAVRSNDPSPFAKKQESPSYLPISIVDTISLAKQDNEPVFDTSKKIIDYSSSTRASLVAVFIEKQEIIRAIVIKHGSIVMDHSRRALLEAQRAQKLSVRASQAAEEEKTIWDTVLNATGGIGGAVSITIGGTLLATGNPVTMIAGALIIISGICSVGSTILEQVGVKNEVTMGVQIVGGVVGLASGGFSLFTAADKIPLVLQIGSALISVAGHSASGIANYFKQQSLIHQEEGALFDAAINVDQDSLKAAGKLLRHVSDEDSTTHELFLMLLKREEDVYFITLKKIGEG